MTQINPYLHFNGTCREAMEFYRSSLGGELKLMTVGESPMAARMPAAMHKNILHATLVSEGFTLMASDMMGPEGLRRRQCRLPVAGGGNRQELEAIFAKLSAGGKVTHALQEEFFGLHGALTDRLRDRLDVHASRIRSGGRRRSAISRSRAGCRARCLSPRACPASAFRSCTCCLPSG